MLALSALVTFAFAVSGTAAASETTGVVAEDYPVFVTGTSTGTEYLTTNYGIYTCNGATLGGALDEPSTTLVTDELWWPEYCTGPIQSQAQVHPNGCQFEITAGSGAAQSFDAQVAIGPEGCGPIKIQGSAGFCNIVIEPQSGLKGSLTNSDSGSSASVDFGIVASHLHYATECGGRKEYLTNGNYSASWNLTASGFEGATGLKVDDSFQVSPGVVTGLARNVSAGGATVSGKVDPNVLSTTYKVQYGPTANYGSETSSESVGAGSTPVSVSRTLSGLTPGTIYHYRIVATNSQGTTYGLDQTVETVQIGATSAEIAWPSAASEVSVLSALSSEQVVTTNAGSVRCEEGVGTAAVTSTGAANLAMGNLGYHDTEAATCRGPVGSSMAFGANGCQYQFHVGQLVAMNEAYGSLTIGACATQGGVVWNGGPLCTVRLPEQDIGQVTFRLVGGSVIGVDVKSNSLTYDTSGLCGSYAGTNGSYQGTIYLAADEGSLAIE